MFSKKKTANRFKRSGNRKKKPSVPHWVPLMQCLGRVTLLSAFIVLMALAFIFCHDFMLQSSFFAAKTIDIRGLEHLTAETVTQMTSIENGTNTLSVNLNRVRKKLLTHPWIREADVIRELPATIIITIEEQTAVAVVDFGEKFLLNAQGEVFKKRNDSDQPMLPVNLPVITGLQLENIDQNGKFQNDSHRPVMEILTLGNDAHSILPARLINHVDVDDDTGVLLVMNPSVELHFARTIMLGFDHYSEKLLRLKEIFAYIETRKPVAGDENGENGEEGSQLDFIDLNHVNRVVVRPSKDFIPSEGTKEV